ncbi:MAG: (Fe-S)-binding protein [Anaerolineae bacterium]|nr:(Fe-S)-binding protein [Anaerolineae bacterium]
MDTKTLEQHAADIYTCNRTRCAFCVADCPVYRVKGFEAYTSRGKMMIARGLLEGLVEPSPEMQDILEGCLLCGYCQARCALTNLEVFTLLRQTLAEEGLSAPQHEQKVARIVQEGALFDRPADLRRQGTVPLYLGCLYQSKPVEARTIISVLERCGIDPLVIQETCCGYFAEATGFTADFERIQQTFREAYGAQAEKEILTLCPTCTVTLREKYGLKVKHAIVAVAEKIGELSPRQLQMRATYHDPCHLGRMLGIFEEPREILRALGVELVEMEHNRMFSACCGGGGGVADTDPALSMEVAKNRVRDALEAGVQTIVTVCPTCEPTLLRAASRLANEVGVFVDVRGLWDLLDQALPPKG